ncbi:MAG: hypothetical protein JL50_17325 [Peptococcaceae bacterium BICA1-7]|nr:MAG: hypothetical protein JL50_17325 [Peptococcaceae bacterium BICA1-7]HBV98689.1 DUF4309 domain-containing protein [Desulfotomaculum sp.]
MVKIFALKRCILIPALAFVLLVSGCSDADNGKISPNQDGAKAPPSAESDNGSRQGDSAVQVIDQQKALISRVMELARQGKVVNSQFAAEETVIDDVEKEWGRPEKTDYVPEAKGNFASYTGRGVVIGYNKGSQVFDIRSYDSELKKITLSGVRGVLGSPAHTSSYNNQDILGYTAGDKFKIRFVFPRSTTDTTDPALDHVSVFYPRGTVNSMSEDPGLEW